MTNTPSRLVTKSRTTVAGDAAIRLSRRLRRWFRA